MAQVLDNLCSAQTRIEGKFAGQVADQLFDFGGGFPAVQPFDGRTATARLQQAHENAHGCGFASAIRTQEAKDFALLNTESHVDNAPTPAVAFSEPIGLNAERHRFSLLRTTRTI